MPKNTLFGRRVVEIAEGDFLPLRDGSLNSVYIQINALVGGLGTAVDVELPFQKGSIAGSNEGRQPVYQCPALAVRDKPSGLNGVNQQLNLRRFKMPRRHMIEILNPAVFDNVHTEFC